MKSLEDGILFDDDSDFEAYAVSPNVKVYQRLDGSVYYDWDWTTSYKEALESQKPLYMNDAESLILKRQAVSHKFITKNVNILPYNG